MSLAPLALIMLSTIGSVVSLIVLYWVIRFAVRHGIEDAWQRRGHEERTSGYWEPAARR
jgi:membrane protein DedA with SNARE-associated domain